MAVKLTPDDLKVFTNKQLQQLLSGVTREELYPIVNYKRLLNTKNEHHINWSALDVHSWYTILRDRPDLIWRCTSIDHMSTVSKAWLLSCHPHLHQLTATMNFDELTSSDWMNLLPNAPQFAERCNDWSVLEGDAWSAILRAQPQLSTHCVWSKLTGVRWAHLLVVQPQFAEHCDWSTLMGCNWLHLLSEQPQFADRCDWSKMDDVYWGELLKHQPQLSSYRK